MKVGGRWKEEVAGREAGEERTEWRKGGGEIEGRKEGTREAGGNRKEG